MLITVRGMSTAWWVLVCAAAALLGYGVALLHTAGRGDPVGEPPRGAAYFTLPLTGLAARHLRTGLSAESAAKAVRHLRLLLGTSGLAIVSTDRVLAWDSAGDHDHVTPLPAEAGPAGHDLGTDRCAGHRAGAHPAARPIGPPVPRETARWEYRGGRIEVSPPPAAGRGHDARTGAAGRPRGGPRHAGRGRGAEPGRRGGPGRGSGHRRAPRRGWAQPPEDAVLGHVRGVLAGGRAHIVTRDEAGCGAPGCPLRAAVVVPLTVGGRVVGALAAYDAHADAALLRTADELGRWVSGQLELAELDECRRRVAEAEFQALTAQISPHFVYNSLTAIASFVRTDPTRARELLLDFADFARYALRRARRFTTLADELGCVDRYLLLERARFGDRLRFSVRVPPEVLPVPVPFLCLQPIVENAIKHGLRATDGAGEVRVVVRDAGPEAHITIEDDGVGMDPEQVKALLEGRRTGSGGVGLTNVDRRLRQIYGPEYGLVVESAPGQGTKVRLRVPKNWDKHSGA
ncbi:histidine kinase/DNA gyrase B/HSP90-like ATPase [Thermopolyspora flexuosa]|uniref:histidine kinase n=2 Tax=Thermopolyspora flexuosa TaxID=103836 RepID=A0A543IZV8_9ACTN|nr:histidine kinase/DNA gyrase B/HSP90-like ATPase [Thermopolyspora flexuosa]